MNISFNVWAILVSGILHWVIGAFWYSPLLFAKPWANAKGIDMDADPDMGPSIWMYLSGLLTGLLLASAMAILISIAGLTSVGTVLLAGICMWLGFHAGPAFANAMFGGSIQLWIIDSLYPLVSVILMSFILTAWT